VSRNRNIFIPYKKDMRMTCEHGIISTGQVCVYCKIDSLEKHNRQLEDWIVKVLDSSDFNEAQLNCALEILGLKEQ
jgi:hypothetical protein